MKKNLCSVLYILFFFVSFWLVHTYVGHPWDLFYELLIYFLIVILMFSPQKKLQTLFCILTGISLLLISNYIASPLDSILKVLILVMLVCAKLALAPSLTKL